MHSDVVREGVAGGMVDAAEEVIRQGHAPTLRDRFAMAALQGDIASEHEGWAITDKADGPTREQQLAERAYRMADAMLEARKPTKVQL